jgi:hypothetical protein
MSKNKKYIEVDGFKVGKKDKILDFYSKWPIFKLNINDKNGLWNTFFTKLEDLENSNKLILATVDEINSFLYTNADIEFEMHAFDDLMQKHHILKIYDKILCYSIGTFTKNTKNLMYVRFFFDLKEFFSY